jgi:uncharacterized protein (TIGR02246 family)
MRRFTLLALCLGLLTTPALSQTAAQIQKLNDQWMAAFNRGDAAAVAAMYTIDAYVLPDGREMVKGRPAIEALWKQQMAGATVEKITTLDVKPLGGNAAREIGTATMKTKAQPPLDVVIKYAVVWQKEGGQWKLLQDIWNMNEPLPMH